MARTIVVAVKATPLGTPVAALTQVGTSAEPARWRLDPINEITLEWAVTRREAGDVDRVVAVSVGSPAACSAALRAAHARGSDEQVEVSTGRQADILSTARLLAAAARRAGATVVACGYESYDGCSGTVPTATAAMLGWGVATRLRDARLTGGRLAAERSHVSGTARLTARLPAVVSFVEGAIVPRNPSLAAAIAARRDAPDQIDADELLGADRMTEWTTGLQEVVPVARRARDTQTLELEAGVRAILDLVGEIRNGVPAQGGVGSA